MIELRKNVQSKNTLILVHPAGGTIYCYMQLLSHLSNDDFNILGIEASVASATNVEATLNDVSRQYADLVAKYLTGEVIIGGYSFGGNVAVEMASILAKRGRKIPYVYLIDSHPPLAYKNSILDEETYQKVFPLLLGQIFGYEINNEGSKYDMSLADVLNVLTANDLLPEGLGESDVAVFFDIWKQNHAALRNYRQEGKIESDIVLFKGIDSESEKLLNMLKMKIVPKELWMEATIGKVRVINVPGNHYTMFSLPENVSVLAEYLDNQLTSFTLRNKEI